MINLAIKLLLVAGCGFLWRLGGSDYAHKLYRRAGCALHIIAGAIISQNWWGVLSLPLLFAAFSLGYGHNSHLMKWTKSKTLTRLLCGLAYGLSAIFVLWGNWWLFTFHVLLCSVGVMLAGTQKFKFEDHREEGFIGLCVGIAPIFA